MRSVQMHALEVHVINDDENVVRTMGYVVLLFQQ